MEQTSESTRECPYCKEEIKRDATKCKYCQSRLLPEVPEHGGTCPYCKEPIKPDAIKCKHCHSILRTTACLDCIDQSPNIGTPRQFILSGAEMGGFSSFGQPHGISMAARAPQSPGGGEDTSDREFCFEILVPDCIYIPGGPVPSRDGAGYFPDRLICFGWKPKKICVKIPVIF